MIAVSTQLCKQEYAVVVRGTFAGNYRARMVNSERRTIILKLSFSEHPSYLLNKQQKKTSSRYRNNSHRAEMVTRHSCGRGEMMATTIGRCGLCPRFEGIEKFWMSLRCSIDWNVTWTKCHRKTSCSSASLAFESNDIRLEGVWNV